MIHWYVSWQNWCCLAPLLAIYRGGGVRRSHRNIIFPWFPDTLKHFLYITWKYCRQEKVKLWSLVYAWISWAHREHNVSCQLLMGKRNAGRVYAGSVSYWVYVKWKVEKGNLLSGKCYAGRQRRELVHGKRKVGTLTLRTNCHYYKSIVIRGKSWVKFCSRSSFSLDALGAFGLLNLRDAVPWCVTTWKTREGRRGILANFWGRD